MLPRTRVRRLDICGDTGAAELRQAVLAEYMDWMLKECPGPESEMFSKFLRSQAKLEFAGYSCPQNGPDGRSDKRARSASSPPSRVRRRGRVAITRR